jgi:hypothetical protein
MQNCKKISLVIAMLISTNLCNAAQVEWTKENCIKVRSLSDGSVDYLNSLVGKWTIKYTETKMVYSQNRLGCFVHLDTPNTPYTCTTSALHSDGKSVWAHVHQCAPSGNFSF